MPPWFAVGSAGFVFVTSKETDVSPFAARPEYGRDAGVAEKPAGRVSETLPDWAWPLQLWRSTRTARVSPVPIESTGFTSPPSCGTPVSRAHCSNCATCGSRCTVPRTAGATRTTRSV